jgi:hypothetical protein
MGFKLSPIEEGKPCEPNKPEPPKCETKSDKKKDKK